MGDPTSSSPGPVARIRALRAHLDTSLFLPSPAPRQRLSRWEGLVIGLAVLALAVVAQLLRIGPSTAFDSLWAEDGPIYLQGALTQGPWDAVTSTYATYLVVVPRLIGEGASLVPLSDAPAAVAILSALVVGLCGLAVWFASAAHVRDPYLRATLVVLAVLPPVAGLESLDSAAYVPWYMLFACFWVLLWRPRGWLGVSLGALLLLMTGLSTPGVWFFAPLAGLRLLAARDRRDLTIVGGYALGAAVQLPVLAFNNEVAVEPAWSEHIWTDYLQRIVDGAPFGLQLGGEAWSHLGWPLLIGLLAFGLAALAVGLRGASPAARWIAAIAVPTSLALFVVSLYQRALGIQMLWPEGAYNGTGSRYAIVPALLLISSALVLIDRPSLKRPRPELPSWLGLATIALLLIALATSFYEGEEIVRGTPGWDEQLDVAAVACGVEPLAETTVQTSPPGFGMAVPCDALPDGH